MRRLMWGLILSMAPLTMVQASCLPGAAVEIFWNGSWWPGKIKQGPDADGRCYVGYDGYGADWDAWMAADALREPQATAAASSAPGASPARSPFVRPATFVPKRDDCTVGERVMTAEGVAGTVSSVGAVGSCFVDLDDGGSVAGAPSQFHSLSSNQGLVLGEPALTVYRCHSPEILVRAEVMFSLRPGNRYRHFDGGSGSYRYDASTTTLNMQSGPLDGVRYFRSGETSFSLIEAGQPGNVTCVSNPALDADRPPW